jgi:hypothetical protein
MLSKNNTTTLAAGHGTFVGVRIKKVLIKSIKRINTSDEGSSFLADFVVLPSWKDYASPEIAKWIWVVLTQARQKRRRLSPFFILYMARWVKNQKNNSKCEEQLYKNM